MIERIPYISLLVAILTVQGGVVGIDGFVTSSLLTLTKVQLHHRHKESARVPCPKNHSNGKDLLRLKSLVPTEQYPSFESVLWHHIRNEDETSISVEGYVLSKRSLGNGLVFADFYISTYPDVCQAMLRTDRFQEDFIAARKLLLKGTKVRLTGKATTTRIPGNVVLTIESLEFLGFPRDKQYIEMLIQQYQDGLIPKDRILEALPPEDNQALLHRMIESENSKLLRKQLAKDIFESLPEDNIYHEVTNRLTQSTKSSNFAVPPAPSEWMTVPHTIFNTRRHDSRTPNLATGSDRIRDASSGFSPSSITISGWVQNRRRFDGNITMVSLVDDLASITTATESGVDSTGRIVAILHPDLISPHTAGLYRNVAAVGSKLELSGDLVLDKSSSSNGENCDERRRGVLWVHSVRLVQCSSRSVTVCHLLDLVHDGFVELEEARRALLIDSAEEANSLIEMDATQRRWKANELAVRLQAISSVNNKDSQSSYDLPILNKYRRITERHPIKETSLKEMEDLLFTLTTVHTPRRDKQPARSVLPLGMPGSIWQRKKRPQLAWMGEQIRTVLESHPDYGKRKLQILDIGGGKGSLAHYLGQTLHEDVQIRVVDISAGAVANGAKKAMRLNLPVDFSLADASQSLDLTTVDVVVALHACGHLSDVALAHALQRKAGFVIVPCCFNSNPHLTIPTDTEEKVSVPSWLDIPTDDWSSLKLLAEVQGDITLANKAIASICAVRADAAYRYLSRDEATSDSGDPKVSSATVTIKRFPIEFSTRNTVLVGTCKR